MAYDYNVRNIWVVNVGDVKPLEMEINYAMDIAYDMEKWGKQNTAETYKKQWLQKQLGGAANCPDDVAEKTAECVSDFLKISTYRKAEFVKPTLYSNVNYNEAQEVLKLCNKTIDNANYLYDNYYKYTSWDDAYYQIVYYQAVATANVTRMMIFKSLNDYYAKQNSSLANIYAAYVDECVEYDKELTDYYNNTMSGGKWKKMMSSPHVGFVTWDSKGWSYPEGSRVTLPSEAKMLVSFEGDERAYETGKAELPLFTNTMKQRYCVTMDKYKVTSLTNTGGTAAVTGPAKKTIKKAVIPSKVKIKGRTLKVTAVGNKAFKNLRKLKSVTIGANIKKIGANSFSGCAGLKKITVKSYNLNAVGKKAFSGISKKAVLKAPAKLKKKYNKFIKL